MVEGAAAGPGLGSLPGTHPLVQSLVSRTPGYTPVADAAHAELLRQAGLGGLSASQVAAIRARNLAHPPPVVQTASVEPLSPQSSLALAAANRGSGVLDPTRTGTDPSVVERLRQQFSGPGTAGFNFLAGLLGKDLAGYVGPHVGATSPLGYRPNHGLAALEAAGVAVGVAAPKLAGRAVDEAGQLLSRLRPSATSNVIRPVLRGEGERLGDMSQYGHVVRTGQWLRSSAAGRRVMKGLLASNLGAWGLAAHMERLRQQRSDQQYLRQIEISNAAYAQPPFQP